MVKITPLIFTFLFFLFIKLPYLGLRLSDTNIYFYTGFEILKGKLLYKDIFFTNLPLFAYISSAYHFLTQGNINLFYSTAILEAIFTSFLIYLILNKQTKNYMLSITSSIFYLFSFIVLSTSDHQTGIFTASFFAVLSFYFLEERRFFFCGVFLAFSLMTKAYFLPIVASFFLYLLVKKEIKNVIYLFFGFVITLILILSPFIVFAKQQLIKDVFEYSLTRNAGVSKIDLVWFFITHDILLFILFLFNIYNIKKNIFFGIISLLSLLFFFFYQDIYYLYLNFFVPFLCLSLPNFNNFLNLKFKLQKMVLPTIIFFLLLFNIFIYIFYYRDLQTISNPNLLINTIKKEKPQFIYGVNDIAPILSYLTNTPLLDNIIDTNENIFRKNILDKNLLTNKAISNKSILISHGAFYPKLGIEQYLLDPIFDKQAVEKSCKLILSVPTKAEGVANRINLFKCY